ncbi:PHO85 cyclin-like protein psl1 [Wickerhamiella sorbophila]|uniref:PHO85 cyclin-like protein psl1 n=1 Tax=Wickerhamiella sorbophila TaxID=45607 RepID=A0A2T0FKP9_9ASCO|nr:PHO85 cyclin-like protein psl1 [Wickerhamiella sorbophila]PRT55574.1 PHO85 cyclin-like protein psl1 [Wickerhamiella sorbophila]
MSDELEEFYPSPSQDLNSLTHKQALFCISRMLEVLVELHDQYAAGLPESEPTSHHPSISESHEEAKQIAAQLDTIHKATTVESEAVIEENIDSEHEQLIVLYKRFWLKQPPGISIRSYLQRFDRYCHHSVATYLTAGAYVYHLCVVLKKLPLTRRNVHRIFSAAFVVAAKVVEDILYPWQRYATTAGVSAGDMGRLEIALLYLLDFGVKIDLERLEDAFEDWTRLVLAVSALA